MYDKILVPLDGSEFAERVIDRIVPLAQKLGSTLVLLQVTTAVETIIAQTTPNMPGAQGAYVDPQPIMEGEQAAAAEYLDGLAARLRALGCKVEVEHPAGHAAITVIARAHALGADLIAMTTHGRSGLGRMVFGSVAEEIVHHSDCPVLLVRLNADKAKKA